MSAVLEQVRIVPKGLVPYESAFEEMRKFTSMRKPTTPDELWLLEHPPVYTLGLAADARHGPKSANGIPLVQADRGGEITYHGPGQLVLYTLVDLARRGIRVKQFVSMLEQSVIDLLEGRAEGNSEARGVYVNGAKVAALGIRVSRGCAYHGIALNVDMDLVPFAAIDPCGYPGLRVTQTRELGFDYSVESAGERLALILLEKLDHA